MKKTLLLGAICLGLLVALSACGIGGSSTPAFGSKGYLFTESSN